jgi:hypothetical protein
MIQNAAGNLMKLASTTASGDLTEDVLELQGKVSALETSVGTKEEESSITASNLWAAIEEVKAAYEALLMENLMIIIIKQKQILRLTKKLLLQ